MKNNVSKIVYLMLFVFCTALQAKSQNQIYGSIEPSLKILSWNIYMLPYVSLVNGNSNRARMIVDELQSSDYQIIVFQEAFSSRCRHILAKGLAANYPYQYGPANRNIVPLRTNSGLWVISKIPLRQIEQIVFNHTSGFDKIARKGAVLFEGLYENHTFQLLATHLQADSPQTLREAECESIQQKLLLPNSKPDVPQLLCGDFNVDMDNYSQYHKMLTTLDAQNGEISGELTTTYDEVNNTLAYVPKGKLRIIDYILIRNDRQIDTIERRVNPFSKMMGDKKLFLSDHYAMEANIHFKTPDLLTTFAQIGR